MASPYAERAIADALKHGKAIIKAIVPNEIPGMTGSHQYGYYLPKRAWQLFTRHAPVKGENQEEEVSVLWQNGQTTDSRVKWYGKNTRSEYRMTCFGKDFPYLTRDSVGDLLVLIPKNYREFLGYVLHHDEDMEEIQNALGVDLVARFAIYDSELEPTPETEESCIERLSREYAATVEEFPATKTISLETWRILNECVRQFGKQPSDNQLLKCIEAEYELFRIMERKICEPDVLGLFKDIDDFLATANSIMQRRKSRAGASLEHHVERLFTAAEIPFDRQPSIDGNPDIIIPSKEAYEDNSFPVSKLFVVGVKRTCKDRWRQVVQEAKRVPHKHILTLQQGVTEPQMQLMTDAKVTLIVPERFHSDYPKPCRPLLLNVDKFISSVHEVLNK